MFKEMLLEKGKEYCRYYAGDIEPLYIALEPYFISYAQEICDRCVSKGIDIENNKEAQVKINRTYFLAMQQYLVNHYEEGIGDMSKKVTVEEVIDECLEKQFGIVRNVKK